VSACNKYVHIEKFRTTKEKWLLSSLSRDLETYVMHFERYAASIVSVIGYARRIPSSEDPIITEVIAVMHNAADLNVPGTTHLCQY